MDPDGQRLSVGGWHIAEDISTWIEIVAVVVIAVAVVSAFAVGVRAVRVEGVRAAVEQTKQVVGRGLLLGLDLLIAADVIRTVTLEPTLQNVAALGLLVLVRTFLAWSLMVELHGIGHGSDPGRRRRSDRGSKVTFVCSDRPSARDPAS